MTFKGYTRAHCSTHSPCTRRFRIIIIYVRVYTLYVYTQHVIFQCLSDFPNTQCRILCVLHDVPLYNTSSANERLSPSATTPGLINEKGCVYNNDNHNNDNKCASHAHRIIMIV